MEQPERPDAIFEEKLSFPEILKRTWKVFIFYRKDILLSFLGYFIPLLVLLSLIFQSSLAPSPESIQKNFTQNWIFLMVHNLFQDFFFAGLIIYVIVYFEKKIMHPGIFFRVLFQRFFIFVLTFALLFSFMMAGILAFIVPGLVIAILFSFSLFLVFSENLSGLEAFQESYRTVKESWIRVTLYFIGVNAISFVLSFGTIYLVAHWPWERPEIKFLLGELFSSFLNLFPSLVFAVLFYNLRNQVKPPTRSEKPISNV
jgi:hypothetical protein